MKTKTIIAAALLTAGLGFGAVSTPTSAASWHNGTPKILQGKWRTKAKYVSRWKTKARGTLQISKHHFSYQAWSMPDPNGLGKMQYKHTGHGVYLLSGRIYTNAPAGGIKTKFKFKLYNAHKLYMKSYAGDAHYANRVYYKY